MSARQADRQRLASLVGGVVAGRDLAGLCRFLVAHSGLPGPRAHLELAQAFADLTALEINKTILAQGDPDGLWIVRENLKKARLRKRSPDKVAALERLLRNQ